MKQFNAVAILGALARTPFTRTVDVPNSPDKLFVAEATVAVVSKRPNGSDLTSYLPVTLVGPAAQRLMERVNEGKPTAILIDGVFQRDTWTNGEGKDMQRLKVKNLHAEIAEGDFTFITDAKGNFRLADGMNHAAIGGNVVEDVKLRITPAGDKVTDVAVALNNRYTNRAGQVKEETAFVRVTFWRDDAERAAQLKKGDAVYITGSVTSESWKDKDDKVQSTIKMEGYTLVKISTPERQDAQHTTGTNGAPAPVTEADVPPTETPEELPF